MGKNKSAAMSLLDFFMLGFGSMIGVGWSVAVNGWFSKGGGPVPTFLAFIIGVALMIPIGLCYGELTSAMPKAGGAINFAYKAFGKFPSFLTGWIIALAYITILPWEAIYINDVLALIFPSLKAGAPLYTIAGVGIYKNGLIVGIVLALLVIALNWVGSKIAAKAQTYLTFVLVITGIIVIIFALINADFENLKPIYENVGVGNHSSFPTGMLAVFAIVPFFMAGFDTIPQGVEEGGLNLDYKNLGKVLISSIIAAGSFYCIIIISTGLAMPWKEFATFDTPAISLLFTHIYGNGFLGKALYWVSLIGAVAGLFTTWNGLYIASARLLLGMGRARLIPKFFASVHSKYDTPKGANIFCGIATLIGPFVGMGVIDPLTVVGSTAFAIGWFIVCISAVRLRKTDPLMERPFTMPGGIKTAWMGTILSLAIGLSTFIPTLPGYMGTIGIVIFGIWFLMGIAFYAISKGDQDSRDDEDNMELNEIEAFE